ncbi:nitroreductase/quinone reductase family protein [Isoptericola sp. NPDC057559]|uniref:nitroreductase/quinone reductase family protein n=1 Tax=Isoptericola sp. NPDC057559 TaxID=3346168 RepID=UPI003692E28E
MPSLQSPFVRRFVRAFNTGVLAWRSSPRWGGAARRHLTILTYTGRRSGRVFSIPVGYRRRGEVVTIGAMLPDAKLWWRNFLGAGAAATVEVDGVARPGHAVAVRDDAGRVTVTVRLDPLAGPGAPAPAEVPVARAE